MSKLYFEKDFDMERGFNVGLRQDQLIWLADELAAQDTKYGYNCGQHTIVVEDDRYTIFVDDNNDIHVIYVRTNYSSLKERKLYIKGEALSKSFTDGQLIELSNLLTDEDLVKNDTVLELDEGTYDLRVNYLNNIELLDFKD